MPSSTSSFDPSVYEAEFEHLPRRGKPWGLLLALPLVIVAEVAYRQIDVRALSVYEMDRIQQHAAVRDQVGLLGPADVVFIGDSRTQAGIDNEQVARVLREHFGDAVTFGNYACSSAMVEQQDYITRLVVDRPAAERPRLVLWGVMPNQVLAWEVDYARTAHYWLIGDWFVEQLHADRLLFAELGTVAQNHVGRVLWLHRFRLGASARIKERWLGVEPSPNPIVGEPNPRHLTSPDGRADDAFIARSATRYTREAREVGLSDDRVARYEVIARRCAEAGVPLVLFELPLPSETMSRYPLELLDEFRARVGAIASSCGASYYRIDELGVAIPDRHFREHSHMNYLGARQFTAAILDRVLLPRLEGMRGEPAVDHDPDRDATGQ